MCVDVWTCLRQFGELGRGFTDEGPCRIVAVAGMGDFVLILSSFMKNDSTAALKIYVLLIGLHSLWRGVTSWLREMECSFGIAIAGGYCNSGRHLAE